LDRKIDDLRVLVLRPVRHDRTVTPTPVVAVVSVRELPGAGPSLPVLRLHLAFGEQPEDLGLGLAWVGWRMAVDLPARTG
jgi:hypothetical protein